MQEKLITRKVVLSLAGVLAAAAFAPEASALPAFARQVGRACTACHTQHFPVLNAYGRDFKANGYTMMGRQKQVKGEHLAIPDTLNAAMLLKARYQKTNGADVPPVPSGTTTNSGQWQIPDEFSLFMGGRVAENVGFLFEGSLVGGGLGNGSLAAALKVPFVFDVGAAKLSAIPFLSDVGGPGYGYELSSTGVIAGVRWSEHRTDISAAQYVGFRHAVSGLSFVAQNDLGYINLTRFSPNFAMGATPAAVQLRSNYVRIAATPSFGDWGLHIGAGFVSGSNFTMGPAAAPVLTPVDTKATIVDLQAQGLLGGNEVSFYATYGNAPAAAVGALALNMYNAGTTAKRAFTIGADYSVIPHTLHLGAAYRNAHNGVVNAVTGAAETDNSFTVQAIYDYAQNLALHAVYSKRSGSAYNVGGSMGPAATGAWMGDSLATFMLEGAW